MSVSDDLAPPLPPNRVFYSLGRMLGVEDFQADQDYHRGRLARALLQVCGTGTVCGLSVQLSQSWQPESTYPAWTFVIDPAGDVEVNTGNGGISGTTTPAWPAAGKSVTDGTVTWTNEATEATVIGPDRRARKRRGIVISRAYDALCPGGRRVASDELYQYSDEAVFRADRQRRTWAWRVVG